LAPKLSELRKVLNKKFGENSIMSLSDAPSKVPAISTGSLSLDNITGVGGFPIGRITELFGGESSGKTTIALQAVANAQKENRACFYIDFEHALDMRYAKALGVSTDPELFMVAQPSFGEEGLELARSVIESGAVGIVVIDSVAAMSPRAEAEGEIGDATMASQARLMGKAMRVLSSSVHHNEVALIMINQDRTSMGQTYGNPNITPGGAALKYAASLRIGLNRSKSLGKQGAETGHIVLARVTKNKVAPPFRRCEFQILFGKGVILEAEMVDLGLAANLWERKGSWYSIDGENVAQGAENFTKYLQDLAQTNPTKFEEYLAVCKAYSGGIDDSIIEEPSTDNDGDDLGE
jgi:recombination protein RecA